MRRCKRRSFDFENFEITKREILASISIVAVMLLIGILIAGKISDYHLDKNEKYNKAIKIESHELFEYGMRTNVGNAFVYGDLKAVDTVTYPEIGGEYMYIKKVKERYTMHTRRVSHRKTVNGKTHTYYTTETYWTWEYYSKPLEASPLMGGAPAGIFSKMFGIVEFSDGVRRVDPSEIVFCDEENQMLSEMEKMRKEKEAND